MQFRSKKNKAGKNQSYPISPPSSRKTPKPNYSSGRPSWSSKADIHGDIKKMHRQDNPRDPMDHTREHNLYKKQLVHEADKTDIKETVRANKRQKKILKKDEKSQMKEAIKNEKEQDEKEKDQDDEIRHDAGIVDGNDNRSY